MPIVSTRSPVAICLKKYVGADCVARMTRQTGDAARKLSARTVQMPKSCAFAGD
jgi:hypothetical protein